MQQRQETPGIEVRRIITGHFDERGAYSVYRARGTPDWLLVYTLAGRGRLGADLFARPGELTILRPGTLHDYGLVGPDLHWELLWAHFHPRAEWSPLLQLPQAAPGLGHLA